MKRILNKREMLVAKITATGLLCICIMIIGIM